MKSSCLKMKKRYTKNMFRIYTPISKKIALVLFTTLLLINSVGVLIAMGAMDHMSPCPLMNEMDICAMDILTHITIWKVLFSATIPLISVLLLVGIALFKAVPKIKNKAFVSQKQKYCIKNIHNINPSTKFKRAIYLATTQPKLISKIA